MSYVKTRYGKIKKRELRLRAIPDSPKVKLTWKFEDLFIDGIDDASNFNVSYFDRKFNQIKNLEGDRDVYFRARSSPHYVKLPIVLDPRLAYFLGYMYGDGSLKNIFKTYFGHGRYEHSILVCDEFEITMTYLIKPLMKSLFNLDVSVKNGEELGCYYIRVTSKIGYRFLSQIFGFPIGYKNEISIPEIIMQAPSEIRRWFISGVFDSDGSTRIMENRLGKTPSFRLQLKMKSKTFILQIQEMLLEDFRINMTGPYTDEGKYWYILGAKGVSLIANYRKLFIHPIKEWRLRTQCFGAVAQPGENTAECWFSGKRAHD